MDFIKLLIIIRYYIPTAAVSTIFVHYIKKITIYQNYLYNDLYR